MSSSEARPRRGGVVLIGAWIAGTLLWGCGVKTSPRPPERVVPNPVKDLSATVRGGDILLQWTVPDTNTNGTPLRDLDGFRVFRVEKGACPTCPMRFLLRAEVEYRPPSETQVATGRMSFIDRGAEKGGYAYIVRAYNRRGHESADSNRAVLSAIVFPAAPKEVRAVAGDRGVFLEWDPVTTLSTGDPATDIAGYHIYRREASDPYGDSPVNPSPIQGNTFQDFGLFNDRRYFYTVRAVRPSEGKWIEGTPSTEVSAVPRDMIPPDPPEGLRCEEVEGGIRLEWIANREPDLDGYHVYRRREGSLSWERLTTSPCRKAELLDSRVLPNVRYIYAVTAVDRAPQGNESRSSMECRIRRSPSSP